MKCRRCKWEVDPLDAECPKCGAPQRITDKRFCAFCGNLKDPFLDTCPMCDHAYQTPAEREPIRPTRPPQENGAGLCPSCGKSRRLNDTGCPWCDTKMPPVMAE